VITIVIGERARKVSIYLTGHVLERSYKYRKSTLNKKPRRTYPPSPAKGKFLYKPRAKIQTIRRCLTMDENASCDLFLFIMDVCKDFNLSTSFRLIFLIYLTFFFYLLHIAEVHVLRACHEKKTTLSSLASSS